MNLLSALLISFISPICFIPPPEMMYSHDELIENTENILLVECISTEQIPFKKRIQKKMGVESYTLYSFRIIENLKGTTMQEFTWTNIRKTPYSPEEYNNHKDSVFWTQNAGRSTISIGACGATHSFKPENKYLIFSGSTANRKSTECVNNPNDLWLQYVKNKLNDE